MDVSSVAFAAYLVASLLFILSLAGLSRHETARNGVTYGVVGMAVAVVATVALVVDVSDAEDTGLLPLALLVVAVVIGASIGLWRARVVQMTGMPELIALLHSFVGLAAVLVGWNGYLEHPAFALDSLGDIHHAEVFIGVFIGAVTFTGSIVANLKLSARMKSAPLVLPGKNAINLGALGLFVVLTVWFVATPNIGLLVAVTIVALALGWHLVASIGGGDMPVVVSMLNSYSGWAAAASGFLLDNNLLIVTGALVGSSGAYLSYIMCQAMNRSFISVIAGGFGIEAASSEGADYGEHREINAADTADLLADASSVVITPGYGMAVAQAQYPVAELTAALRARGVDVRFGDPPGRRPAARPHERAARRGEGALRHRARDGRDQRRLRRRRRRPGHRRQRHRQPRRPRRARPPIAGMPVLEVWKAKDVVVFKRSMAAGLRRRAEPAVLQGQHPDALRRRQGPGSRRSSARSRPAARTRRSAGVAEPPPDPGRPDAGAPGGVAQGRGVRVHCAISGRSSRCSRM